MKEMPGSLSDICHSGSTNATRWLIVTVAIVSTEKLDASVEYLNDSSTYVISKKGEKYAPDTVVSVARESRDGVLYSYYDDAILDSPRHIFSKVVSILMDSGWHPAKFDTDRHGYPVWILKKPQ